MQYGQPVNPLEGHAMPVLPISRGQSVVEGLPVVGSGDEANNPMMGQPPMIPGMPPPIDYQLESQRRELIITRGDAPDEMQLVRTSMRLSMHPVNVKCPTCQNTGQSKV